MRAAGLPAMSTFCSDAAGLRNEPLPLRNPPRHADRSHRFQGSYGSTKHSLAEMSAFTRMTQQHYTSCLAVPRNICLVPLRIAHTMFVIHMTTSGNLVRKHLGVDEDVISIRSSEVSHTLEDVIHCHLKYRWGVAET